MRHQQRANMNRNIANNRAMMGRGLYRRGMVARPGTYRSLCQFSDERRIYL